MTDQDHAKIVREAEVTQADREAAEAVYAAMAEQFEAEGNVVTLTHAVTPDDDDLIQAFARHRLAAEAAAFEKAAGVADDQTRLNVQARIDRADDDLAFQFQGLGNVIATAIRKLAGEKHD